MLKLLLAAVALQGFAAAGAMAEETPRVTYVQHQVADGHPFLIQEGSDVTIYPVPPRPLQFALIDGRRALVDPDTLEIVTWLLP